MNEEVLQAMYQQVESGDWDYASPPDYTSPSSSIYPTETFAGVIYDFIKEAGKYYDKFPAIIELKKHPMAEDLLKNISCDSWGKAFVPNFVVVDTLTVDIEKIVIESGVFSSVVGFEATVFANANMLNAFSKRVKLGPVDLFKGVDKETLKVAFDLILEDLAEEQGRKLEMLQNTGFGEF